MRRGGRPEVRLRECERRRRGEVGVFGVEPDVVEGREEVGGLQRPTGFRAETDHRLAQLGRRTVTRTGARDARAVELAAVAGGEDQLSRSVRDERAAGLPDRAAMSRRSPHLIDRPGGRHAEYPPLEGGDVADPAEGCVDDAVDEGEAGSLEVIIGVEGDAREILRRARERDREAGLFRARRHVHGMHHELRAAGVTVHIGLRDEVRGAVRVDDGRPQHPVVGTRVRAGSRHLGAGVDRRADAALPDDGPGVGVHAVDPVVVGRDEHHAVDDQRLRVPLSRDRAVEAAPEVTALNHFRAELW
jgi:hypothetical protein